MSIFRKLLIIAVGVCGIITITFALMENESASFMAFFVGLILAALSMVGT